MILLLSQSSIKDKNKLKENTAVKVYINKLNYINNLN